MSGIQADSPDASRDFSDLNPALGHVAGLAREAGLPSLAAETERAGERVAAGRFYLACVGQFKRGKSTLLNALIGEAILPTGVIPVTSVVTVVRHAVDRGARILSKAGVWQGIPIEALAAYVSEAENPDNEKGVEAVEVRVPSPLLEAGMCLVDTPGVGSVFAGATRATWDFAPHIDAALVVLGADPPISAEELALVEEVAGRIDILIFVLSKADRLARAERQEAARFCARVLEERLGRPIGPILEVSAAERLASDGSTFDWERLVTRLADLARYAGADLVKAAEARATSYLAARLLVAIDEQLGALRRPIEETERRLEALHRSTAEVERALGELGHLLSAEQERVIDSLRAEREGFLGRTLGEASSDLLAAVLSLPDQPARGSRERAMALAQDTAKRHLDQWLEEEQPAIERRYRETAQRFVELANGFLERFDAAKDLGLDRLPPLLGPEGGFRVRSHLFYTELLRLTTPSWLTWILDRVRSGRGAVQAALGAATEYMERLLSSNSARIQNDLIERVAASRRQLEADIRSRLSQALEAAEHALERARARHAAGQQAVASEIERLEALRSRAQQLSDSR